MASIQSNNTYLMQRRASPHNAVVIRRSLGMRANHLTWLSEPLGRLVTYKYHAHVNIV